MGFFTQVIDDMLSGFERGLKEKNTMIIPELEKQLYSWSIECRYFFFKSSFAYGESTDGISI